MDILPKRKMFIWKLDNNAVAKVENLNKRGINITRDFVFYGEHQETRDHLFGTCNFTVRFRFYGPLGLNALANTNLNFNAWVTDMIAYLIKRDREDLKELKWFIPSLWTIK